jgi:hypothetical protein
VRAGRQGASATNLFTVVIISVSHKATMFATVSRLHPSLIFVGKVGAYPTGGGRLQALPANISLVCRWLTVTKPLAYDDTEKNYDRKKFYSTGPWSHALARSYLSSQNGV